MKLIHAHKSLLKASLLIICTASVLSTQISAIGIFRPKKLAIATSFTAVFLAYSDNARALATTAFYKSKIKLLQLIQRGELPANEQELVANELKKTETLYATRTGDSFTSEKLRALLKEFKDLIDVCKAGKDAYGWLS